MNTVETLLSAFMGGHPAFRAKRTGRRFMSGPYTYEDLQNHRGVNRLGRETRSRWVGHLGAKERARHVGKPDGAMHGLPPIHVANAMARAARKPRTRKAAVS